MLVNLPTFEELTVTLIVTAVRTIVEASPTILGGVVVAAWLRTRATPERVKVIFRGDDWPHGVLRTVLVGMILPVCSIGVLPVLRELRRLGLPTSKLITLGLVAPLLNPISLLYSFTVLSGSQLIVVFVAAGGLAIIASDVSSRFVVASEVNAETLPAGLTGGTRLRNLLIASTRIVTGWPLIDVMIVALISGMAASLIPAGAFGTVCESSNRGGPLIASLFALPQYVGPAYGIIQLAAIERASLSVPTGLAIFVFGAGLSAGNIFLLIRWYGSRRIVAIMVAMFLFVCTTAYASGAILSPSVKSVEETSGLDCLSRPVVATISRINSAVSGALKFTDSLMLVATLALSLLAVAGAFVRFAKIGYRNDDPELAGDAASGRMSKAVPASQLGAIAICGFAIFCCLATYVVFPAPAECVEDMQTIKMDAVFAIRKGKVSEALEQIAAWDSIAAKLPVSAAVHWSFPTPSQRQATRDLRMALHSTRVFLQDGDVDSARQQIPDLGRLLTETKTTFGGSSS